MANIFLKPTAQFKPFSYQEMLAPIKAYQDAYDALDKELGILEDAASSQAFVFQGSNYESQYKDYLKSLNDITSKMSNGNLSDAKKQIKAARSTFLNTLAPAAQRITKLNTLRDKQNAEQAANPFIRFSIDYRNVDDSDITASSNYTSYDLSKIYDQIAKDTLSRIASDYRPQVGNPINIKGTNSYIVKHGYGMTQEEYEEARNTENSDLNKYIESQVSKATAGITNEDIVKEITKGVEDTIKSNIGKFEQSTVKGNTRSYSDLIKDAEAAYKYEWDEDAKGNFFIKGLSRQYKLDQGWKEDANGEWYKPSSGNTGEKPTDKESSYYDLKTMPASEGKTLEIKNTDIDNKLGRKSGKTDETVTIDGVKKIGLKKFSWDELQKLGVKDLTEDMIVDIVGKGIEINANNAMYYDYYYEDTRGRGGLLHVVRKKDAEIEDIMVEHRSNEKMKEAKGIVRKDGHYYFADSNGKILMNPRRYGLELDYEDQERYKKLIEKLGNKDGYIPFEEKKANQQSTPQPNTAPSGNAGGGDSTEVVVDEDE